MRGLVALVFVIGFCATLLAQAASRSTLITSSAASATSLNIAQPEQGADQKAPITAQFESQDGSIALDRQPDGHFYADVRINGNPVHMLIDTGASGVALSREDAQTVGLATSIGMNNVVGMGADGIVRGEYVKLDRVELGPLSASGVDAVVLNSGQQSLLGQSFLRKFTNVQIEGDRMVLR